MALHFSGGSAMVLYKHTNVTSKTGINFVRSAVENSGSLFHKIEQDNDLGIDALIELTRGEKPLHKQIAVQIKSGPSYYSSSTEECLIPIQTHREYWSSHLLPVMGIVYVPALNRAHWIDIKTYLKNFPAAHIIRYRTSEANRFDIASFSRIVAPTLLRETPQLSFAEAKALFRSAKPDERYLSLIVLFRRYPNELEVWDELTKFFIEKNSSEIPSIMVYFLAHVPWHGDIFHSGEALSSETREYAKERIASFGRNEVTKLLEFIDEEIGIARGSLGQSVEAIVSSLPHAGSTLREIVLDETVDDFRRDCAAIILALKQQAEALPTLQLFAQSGSRVAQEIANQIKEHGSFSPY
jgi:hypothetical protein